jgi:Spy/CpxP family protein refolding chaperone
LKADQEKMRMNGEKQMDKMNEILTPTQQAKLFLGREEHMGGWGKGKGKWDKSKKDSKDSDEKAEEKEDN